MKMINFKFQNDPISHSTFTLSPLLHAVVLNRSDHHDTLSRTFQKTLQSYQEAQVVTPNVLYSYFCFCLHSNTESRPKVGVCL